MYTPSPYSREKSLFLAVVFGRGRVDVKASQSEFRGFMDPAANRAFEWLARVEATTYNISVDVR